MEKTIFRAEQLLENLDEYLETKIEIKKIEAVEIASSWLSRSIVIVLISIHLFLFVVFFSIALAFLLSWIFKSIFLGFCIVAFAYLVGILIIIKSRNRWIRLPLLKLMADRFIKPESPGYEE